MAVTNNLASEYAIDTPAAGGNSATEPAVPERTPEASAAPHSQTPPVGAAPQNGMSREFPKLSSVMVADARKWGVSEDYLNDPDTTPVMVMQAISDARAEARVLARQQAEQRGQVPGRQVPEKDPVTGQFIKANGQVDIDAIRKAEAGGLEDIAFKLDWGKRPDGTEVQENEYDEPLVRILKNMGKELQELKQLRQEVALLRQVESGRQAESTRQRIDRVFASMPAGVKAFIGDGDATTVSQEQRARRMAVLHAADAAQGQGSMEEKILQAATMLFGGATPPAGGQNGISGLRRGPAPEEWNSSGLAIPTPRNGVPDAPGTERAVAGLAQMMKERGLDPELSPHNSTTYDGFPD